MIGMPTTPVRLTIGEARALGERALRAIGYTAQDSASIADHLIDCELRGLEYSGLARIPSIDERLSAVGSAPEPTRITRESPVSAQIEGGDRIGYLVAAEATELAITKAATTGLAAVGANRTWYTGMLSYYAERITAAGFVAFLASNATPWVAPVGGTQAMSGTNPICFGLPSSGAPVIWDIGISEIIHAQAMLAHRTGQPLPPGVAYDTDGHPTIDPLEALGGAFVNWGGHRGSGLGVVVQLLGALAGSPVLPGHLRDFGFFVIAVSPDLFGDADEFSGKVTEYAKALSASRPLDPAHPVRAPFARSTSLRSARRMADLLEVPVEIVDAVTAIASRPAR
mgnify:CR=1 FL=1